MPRMFFHNNDDGNFLTNLTPKNFKATPATMNFKDGLNADGGGSDEYISSSDDLTNLILNNPPLNKHIADDNVADVLSNEFAPRFI